MKLFTRRPTIRELSSRVEPGTAARPRDMEMGWKLASQSREEPGSHHPGLRGVYQPSNRRIDRVDFLRTDNGAHVLVRSAKHVLGARGGNALEASQLSNAPHAAPGSASKAEGPPRVGPRRAVYVLQGPCLGRESNRPSAAGWYVKSAPPGHESGAWWRELGVSRPVRALDQRTDIGMRFGICFIVFFHTSTSLAALPVRLNKLARSSYIPTYTHRTRPEQVGVSKPTKPTYP